jgi:hypothetical protein
MLAMRLRLQQPFACQRNVFPATGAMTFTMGLLAAGALDAIRQTPSQMRRFAVSHVPMALTLPPTGLLIRMQIINIP